MSDTTSNKGEEDIWDMAEGPSKLLNDPEVIAALESSGNYQTHFGAKRRSDATDFFMGKTSVDAQPKADITKKPTSLASLLADTQETELETTGLSPKFVQLLKEAGINIQADVYAKDAQGNYIYGTGEQLGPEKTKLNVEKHKQQSAALFEVTNSFAENHQLFKSLGMQPESYLNFVQNVESVDKLQQLIDSAERVIDWQSAVEDAEKTFELTVTETVITSFEDEPNFDEKLGLDQFSKFLDYHQSKLDEREGDRAAFEDMKTTFEASGLTDTDIFMLQAVEPTKDELLKLIGKTQKAQEATNNIGKDIEELSAVGAYEKAPIAELEVQQDGIEKGNKQIELSNQVG